MREIFKVVFIIFFAVNSGLLSKKNNKTLKDTENKRVKLKKKIKIKFKRLLKLSSINSPL